MNDAEVLLGKIPTDQGVGNMSLITTLGWEEDRYKAARQSLLDQGLIALGRGRGGSVKRKVEGAESAPAEPVEVPADVPAFASDEEAFLFYVPEVGKRINNNKLLLALGWDQIKFDEVRARLIDEQKVWACVAGPGGGTRRWEEGDVKVVAPVKEEVKPADLSGFSSDDEAFLSLLPVDKAINTRRLRVLLDWEDSRYQEVKDRLTEEKKIFSLGGLAIRHWQEGDELKVKKEEVPDEPLLDCSEFENDEEAFLSLVPVDGRVNRHVLKARLGWDAARLKAARKNLVEANRLTVMQGGEVRRFNSSEDESFVEVEEVNDEELGTVDSKDIAIFRCMDEEIARAVIVKLQTEHKYNRTDFYVMADDGDVMIKVRRKHTVPMARDVFERVCRLAEQSAADLLAAKAEAAPVEAVVEEEASGENVL